MGKYDILWKNQHRSVKKVSASWVSQDIQATKNQGQLWKITEDLDETNQLRNKFSIDECKVLHTGSNRKVPILYIYLC